MCAWVNRFLCNSRSQRPNRVTSPLTTTEIRKRRDWWIKRAQQQETNSPQFQNDRVPLNLQENKDGILECRGRIVGHYPVFLPDAAPFPEGIVQEAHIDTLLGGVTLTMAKLRETYWIPRLRKLVKRVRKSCWGSKRFQAIAYASPPPGQLRPTEPREKHHMR